MSTGTELIQDAGRMVGAHSTVSPMDSDAILVGMTALNGMLQMWTSQNIKVPFTPLEAPGDQFGEPADARNAIVGKLALQIAPNFYSEKGIVFPELSANAMRDYNIVKSLYWSGSIPKKVVSATLPKGAGNSKGILREVFFGPGGTLNDSGSS